MADRCAACHAYGWHTEDCPVAKRETPGTDHVPSSTTREPSTNATLESALSEWLEADDDYSIEAFLTLLDRYGLVVSTEYAEAAAAPQARVRDLETALGKVLDRIEKVYPPELGWYVDPIYVEAARLVDGAAEQPTPERDGGLDVERLTRAVHEAIHHTWWWASDEAHARLDRRLADGIAAAYAASPATPADPETPA